MGARMSIQSGEAAPPRPTAAAAAAHARRQAVQVAAPVDWAAQRDKTLKDGKATRERLAAVATRTQAYATSVCTALGVISALIGSGLLAVLLSPPELVYNPEKWTGTGAYAAWPACRTGTPEDWNVVLCYRWQNAFGLSVALAFLLDLMALLITVSVTMGMSSWVSASIFCFTLSLWCVSYAAMAAAFLSATRPVAIASSTFLGLFMLASLFALSPGLLLAWHFVFRKRRTLRKESTAQFGGREVLHMTLKGGGPLHWAAWGLGPWRDFLFVDQLLKILVQTEDLEQAAEDGETALFAAAYRCRASAVKLLLDAGADPNACASRDGNTPLSFAAAGGSLEVVQQLLDCGADPNHVNSNGCSALYWAVKLGHLEVVLELLQRGADPLNKHGRSAWKAATAQARQAAAALDAVVDQDERRAEAGVERQRAEQVKNLCDDILVAIMEAATLA